MIEYWVEVIGKAKIVECENCHRDSSVQTKIVTGHETDIVSVHEVCLCLVCGWCTKEPSTLSWRAPVG